LLQDVVSTTPLQPYIKRWHHKQMAHVLWQPRCLEVASRLHHVRVVDETRRTYRHHGRQRDALRRIATFRHATLRVAPHRYATHEPLGKPGGSRVFRAWLRDAYRSQPEAETEEICQRGRGLALRRPTRRFTPAGLTLAGTIRPEASVQGPLTSWGLQTRQRS